MVSMCDARSEDFEKVYPLRSSCHANWVYTTSNLWLWIFGLAWSFGFLGFWGPSTTLTAEIFPTRIRGVANGVVWFMGYFVGCVLWPFATVALQQATGSFALAILTSRSSWSRWPRGLVHRPRARRQGAQRNRRLSTGHQQRRRGALDRGRRAGHEDPQNSLHPRSS
jgi:hypothetical protein